MMNMKEFKEYLKENIKEYLPPSYTDAAIDFREAIKNGDQHLTGIIIKRPDETVIPTIYVDQMFEEYQAGRDIDEIIGDIADIRIRNEVTLDDEEIVHQFLDYEQVKDKLQIHVCDTGENQERLAGLVHSERSDFSATYHVVIDIDDSEQVSLAVTPELMKRWGVSLEQLHQDALSADMKREPILADMLSMMEELMMGREARNLLVDQDMKESMSAEPMYCLTNQDKTNAAGLIMQDDLMARIAEIVGGNYFVLPSSLHEVMIVPDRGKVELHELSSMVQEINRTQVTPSERLSDEVQYFDKDTGLLENAKNRAVRLEKEKSEKEAEKVVPRSIHEKLEAKKGEQKAAEKKTAVRMKSSEIAI